MKLYVILGSHACRAAMLMLDHKGIEYRTVTVPVGMHVPAMRALRYSGDTVPALRTNGDRVQTNPEIARYLDRVQPEPPLFPADPERRAVVEEAERWGEDEFQMTARRVTLAGALHGRDGLIDRGAEGRLGPLLWKRDRVRYIGSRGLCRFRFGVTPEVERELLGSLPAALDRIDAWIAAGDLGGPELNAADFVIASNLALLCYRAEVRSQVESRPAGDLVQRILPE